MKPFTDIEQSRLNAMTQEEKAEAYNRAIERAKRMFSEKELNYLFPELAESKDEKIRKWLIGTIKQIPDDSIEWKTICKSDVLAWLDRPSELKHKFNIGDIISNGQVVYRVCNITKNCIGQDCYFLVNVESEKDGTRYLKLTDSKGKQSNFGEITWLCEQVDKSFEKQGEQKPDDKVEPTFNVGDWVVNKYGDSWHIDSFDKKNYQVSDGKGNYNYFPISKQDEMRLWTIDDARDGDVFVDEDNNIGIYRGKADDLQWHSYIYLGCDNHLYGFNIGGYHIIRRTKPATKEQRDLLFRKMKEAGYEWDEIKNELKKIEEAPAWSEECDIFLKLTMAAIEYFYDDRDVLRNRLIDWLKSIKESVQPQFIEKYNPYK